jgi:hypothetical protein
MVNCKQNKNVTPILDTTSMDKKPICDYPKYVKAKNLPLRALVVARI